MGAKLSDSGADWQQYEQASSAARTKPKRRVTPAQSEAALTKLAQIDSEIARGIMAAHPDVSVRVQHECDVDCRCCPTCYQRHGTSVCDQTCPHSDDDAA